jgi:hypothetical protein
MTYEQELIDKVYEQIVGAHSWWSNPRNARLRVTPEYSFVRAGNFNLVQLYPRNPFNVRDCGWRMEIRRYKLHSIFECFAASPTYRGALPVKQFCIDRTFPLPVVGGSCFGRLHGDDYYRDHCDIELSVEQNLHLRQLFASAHDEHVKFMSNLGNEQKVAFLKDFVV